MLVLKVLTAILSVIVIVAILALFAFILYALHVFAIEEIKKNNNCTDEEALDKLLRSMTQPDPITHFN